MSDCYFRRLFAEVYALGHDLNARDISDSPSADFQGILNSCGLDWNIHNSRQGKCRSGWRAQLSTFDTNVLSMDRCTDRRWSKVIADQLPSLVERAK